MAMTWLSVLTTFMQPSESYGSGGNVLAVLASMVLWALFGRTR
jgi:hypothetical protein